MKLLVYSHEKEPVTAALHKYKDEIEDLIVLPIQTILDVVEISDTVIDGEPCINWRLPNGLRITNSDDVLLINRVFGCPQNLVAHFEKEDRDYAQCEFHAYLLFAFEAFPNKTSGPNAFCLAGGLIPLPRQWKQVQDHIPELKTPRYFLGKKSFLPTTWEEEKTIFSHLNNYYFWRAGERDHLNEETIFAFQRPNGLPFLATIWGDRIEVHPLDPCHHKVTLDVKIRDQLIEYAQKLSHLFGFLFGEILFFVEEARISFGMIHNVPIAGSQINGFQESVYLCFTQQMATC